MMESQRHNGTLKLTGLHELTTANANLVRHVLGEGLTPSLHLIEIDASKIKIVDSAGLGALLAILQAANKHRAIDPVVFRLVAPTPALQQMLELTRLDHLFEIVTTKYSVAEELSAGKSPSDSSGQPSPVLKTQEADCANPAV